MFLLRTMLRGSGPQQHNIIVPVYTASSSASQSTSQ